MSIRHTLFLLIFVGMAGLLAWHHVTDFQKSAPYKCDAPATHHYTPPTLPLIGEIFFR